MDIKVDDFQDHTIAAQMDTEVSVVILEGLASAYPLPSNYAVEVVVPETVNYTFTDDGEYRAISFGSVEILPEEDLSIVVGTSTTQEELPLATQEVFVQKAENLADYMIVDFHSIEQAAFQEVANNTPSSMEEKDESVVDSSDPIGSPFIPAVTSTPNTSSSTATAEGFVATQLAPDLSTNSVQFVQKLSKCISNSIDNIIVGSEELNLNDQAFTMLSSNEDDQEGRNRKRIHKSKISNKPQKSSEGTPDSGSVPKRKRKNMSLPVTVSSRRFCLKAKRQWQEQQHASNFS